MLLDLRAIKAVSALRARGEELAQRPADSELVDLLIVFGRSLSLIQEIATLYGGRPGRLGLLKLARLSLENLVFADVSQLAADTLGQMMGDRLLATLSAQVAQGLGWG